MRCIEYKDDIIRLLDQRKLPGTIEFIDVTTLDDLCVAIRSLAVRGAPALGVAAAYGLVLCSSKSCNLPGGRLMEELEESARTLAATRPTAVNLFWAIERMMNLARNFQGEPALLKEALREEAVKLHEEDAAMCRRIGEHGAALIRDGDTILTHCNTGALATGDFGTALGVIRTAWSQGKKIHVLVDETRPLLQGARLTAWELQQEKIPYTLITDNMAGHFMARGSVSVVITGADRITARGDGANKIGTYSLAVLAHYHGVPFYLAAPTSTVDLALQSADQITIEERDPREVTHPGGVQVAPEGAAVANPAFDVTPAKLIAGIITEAGVLRAPFEESLRKAVEARRSFEASLY